MKGASGVGYAWCDSNLWNDRFGLTVGAGVKADQWPSAIAVAWPDTCHLSGNAAGDSVKVYVGY